MPLVYKYCDVCGVYDDHFDEYSGIEHECTPKHQSNLILMNYKQNKRSFSKNRDGIIVLCNAESIPLNNNCDTITENNDKHKIWTYVKPNEDVKFSFTITNNMNSEPFLIVGIQLAHPQPQFVMNDNPYIFGKDPHILNQKTTLKNEVYVTFKGQEVGQYEMPIMFTFFRENIKRNLIIIREMVVVVQDTIEVQPFIKSPYTGKEWGKVKHICKTSIEGPVDDQYKIPKLLKILIPRGLNEKGLEGLQLPAETMDQLRQLIVDIRNIFEEGPTESNYKVYFRNLLWWEEFVSRSNLKKYNLAEVLLDQRGILYMLEVPGLAEKRPSLLRGDALLVRVHKDSEVMIQGRIKDILGNTVIIAGLDICFMTRLWTPMVLWDVRFIMSRGPLQRMHEAVSAISTSKQKIRVNPQPVSNPVAVQPITYFFNQLIENNEEQKSAVEHIVSYSSGLAPYIIFGPPGTGKTMTIVEAILQVVVQNPNHRILVCTESNMAADHIALKLLEYNEQLNIDNFILRVNSRSREWSVMPAALHAVSNGMNQETWCDVSNHRVAQYRIVVSTLQHSAKYKNDKKPKLRMTHLFVDEAAQACEPATLVPITGLLSPRGQLVLAGDPKQLGPVIFSKDARENGLEISLLERLETNYKHMYSGDPNYITMLVKNFRSDPDILALPNEFFYNNQLQALAKPDPLSRLSVLGLPGGDSAVVFHSVNSMEQRMGEAPSFFNVKEIEMVKRYVNALVHDHKVKQNEIGVIAPYIRQVYKIKEWLRSAGYTELEVGTVESFQGKEKRVIVVSTVRANCRLLDYDAKYGLGFLVDDKRYNVTLTRAKAKLIIIGNAPCLSRDWKWRMYMEYCIQRNSYHGQEGEQLERTSAMHTLVSRTNFDKCRLTEELKRKQNMEATDTSVLENMVKRMKLDSSP